MYIVLVSSVGSCICFAQCKKYAYYRKYTLDYKMNFSILLHKYYTIYLMYQLYLDAVSQSWNISLLQDGIILHNQSISLSGNESSQLWNLVFWFLDKHSIVLSEIDHVFLIHGPGSFTGIRCICLLFNTLAYIYPHLTLTPISFFDIYQNYPIIKQSSRRDVFVKKQKDDIIHIIPVDELLSYLDFHSEVYGSVDLGLGDFRYLKLIQDYDVQRLIRSTEKKNLRFVTPLYIKNPNIT